MISEPPDSSSENLAYGFPTAALAKSYLGNTAPRTWSSFHESGRICVPPPSIGNGFAQVLGVLRCRQLSDKRRASEPDAASITVIAMTGFQARSCTSAVAEMAEVNAGRHSLIDHHPFLAAEQSPHVTLPRRARARQRSANRCDSPDQ